jgi:hypothetical protein
MEAALFDGVLPAVDGELAFDPARPGLGLLVRRTLDTLADGIDAVVA